MKRTNDYTVTLSIEEEFALMTKYGRKCSPEGLITRAIADAVKSAAPEAPKKAKRTRKAQPDTPLLTGADSNVDEKETDNVSN